MATYKLIQDIEAEDHILGPLTLRQFIFGLVAAFFGYISFIVATKGAPFLLVVFAPPAIFCAFFAFPFGKDQPTEIWFLAKMRFWFLPRRRIWNQSGVKELVTITVPKKEQPVLTDGLSQTEVKSRLQALANTLDTRGWAIKNVGAYTQPAVVMAGDPNRLIDLNSVPQEVPTYDTTAADDILDTDNNPIAQQVDYMINQSTQARHQKLVEEMTTPEPRPSAPTSNNWFMGPSAAALAMPAVAPVQAAAPILAAPIVETPDELALAQQIKQRAKSKEIAYGHMRTMRPLGSQPVAPATPAASVKPVPANDPEIMALAGNNDLNVATLERQANKAKHKNDNPDEVVISLR